MTKSELKRKFLFEMGYEELDDRLFNLYQVKRITSGCYTAYSVYKTYCFNQLLERPLNKITKMEMLLCITSLEKHIERMRKFVEEQENLPFEETQRQQLKEVNENE